MNSHQTINYIEIPTTNIKLTKTFFKEVFNFEFKDFGNDYTSFNDKILNGGFFTSNQTMQSRTGSALIIFYSNNIYDTYNKIIRANGKIVQETFSFPGGRRFHFEDLTGNEYAVWTDIL